MTRRSALLLPKPELARCLFGAVVRDTRGAHLVEAERYNHFPASPLVTLTQVIEGESRLVVRSTDRPDVGTCPALPAISVSGPQTQPFSSWNPGPVFAISFGFYPDAWMQLTGMSPSELTDRTLDNPPDDLITLLRSISADDAGQIWMRFQEAVLPRWAATQTKDPDASTGYGRLLSDWSRAVIVRAAMSPPGRTLRAIQRRVQHWTGQSRRSLEALSRIELLHRLAASGEAASPAELAVAAGFSDQSHMGRAVRRATGYSPVELERLMERDEAFWCYRLLGERF